MALPGALWNSYWLLLDNCGAGGNIVFLFSFCGEKEILAVRSSVRRFYGTAQPLVSLADSVGVPGAIILHLTIVWSLKIPVLNYAVMYFGFGLTWSAMQYVHHYGTERHVTRGARNLRLWEPIDCLWLNHNWHLVHHEHPTVPWIYLPTIGSSEKKATRGFLPWYYLKMWRGPRKAGEHVENQYAGRIIR